MKNTLLALVILASTSFAQAATHEVKMLNLGKEGAMVFEPAFLKVAKGDTIKFLATDPAHDVASVAIPKGAKPFVGVVNKPLTTVVTQEGVYVYECKAHVAMAMVGVIQVGAASNLAEAKAASKPLEAKFVMNKDRLQKYLAQVK